MKFVIFGRELSFNKVAPVKQEPEVEKVDIKKEIQDAVTEAIKNQPAKYIAAIDPYFTELKAKTLYTPSTRNLIVVYGEDVMQAVIEDESIIGKVKQATSKQEIELLLAKPVKYIEPVVEEEEDSTEEEEKAVVSSYLDIFKGNEDFVVVGDNVYFKGVESEPIPTIIVANFIEFLNGKDTPELNAEYEALKRFTMWLLLNPIPAARKDALQFVRKNDIRLTANGLLICYRKIVSKGEGPKDNELGKFVSELYLKVKKQKKSPKNYDVYLNNGVFVGIPVSKETEFTDLKGNLAELYANLSTLKENLYTDAHTHTKEIRLGAIYAEDEDKIDLNNRVECSKGLHVGGKNFGFSGCGDTGVLALVNPMKIRAVPYADAQKMRVSEMFIAGVMDKTNYDITIAENKLLDFSEQYAGETLAELEVMLKNKKLEPLNCKTNTPAITITEVKSITDKLKERIVLV